MDKGGIQIDAAMVDAVFPCHFMIDKADEICGMGPLFKRLCPEAEVGNAVAMHLHVIRPNISLSYDELGKQEHEFLIVQGKSGCRMKGQAVFLENDDRILFIGSPWVTDIADLSGMGLQLDDFQLHTPIGDFLILLQTQKMALRDAERLTRRLELQREELETACQHLSIQHAVTSILADAESTDDAFRRMLKSVAAILDWPLGIVWSLDEDKAHLVYVDAWSEDDPDLRDFVREAVNNEIPLGEGVAGKVAVAGELRWMPDVQESGVAALASAAKASGLHGGFWVPIKSNGRIVGVLEFLSRDVEDIPEDLLVELATLGSQLGQFVDRMVTREALEHACNAAESASRAKSEFLATMSHEIRTPMNGVIGMTDLLLDSKLSPSQAEYAKTVQRSGRALLTIINDILDFSKIEADRMTLEEVNFDLTHVAQGVIDLFSSDAQRKGLKITNRFEDLCVTQLWGDPSRLRQVLMNLVGNAVKFTERGSIEIVFSCHLDRDSSSGELRVEVRDTGMGIDSEVAHVLFEPFIQGDSTTLRRFGGTGLGLAISRRLVELMGGRIGVKSQPGAGSRFWFTVVVGLARTIEAEASSPPRPLPIEGNGCEPLRVLIVEDDSINKLVAVRMVEKLGHEALVVSSGIEALHALEDDVFDIVLMDCEMPEMDGYMATREIRSKDVPVSDVPIVAMTANALKGDREKCIAVGMNDYITKPVTLDRLAEVLQRNV